jgi:hypothetical protein
MSFLSVGIVVSGCTKCGTEIHDESFVYCPHCGTKLEKAVSQSLLGSSGSLRKTGHVIFAFGVELMILALFATLFYKKYDFGTFNFTDYPLAVYSFPLFYLGVLSIASSMVLTALSHRKLKA